MTQSPIAGGALNRPLRVRLDAGDVSKYARIIDVDLASRNWGVVASWSEDIVLTMPEDVGLRQCVLEMVLPHLTLRCST